MCVSSAELEDSIQRLLPGRQATEGSMPFAALLACPYALSSSAQLEVRHTAIELVLSYQHEPEKAQAVPDRGTARNTRKPLVDALSAVKTARGAARISMVCEAKDENSPSRSLACRARRDGIRENASNTTATLNVTSPDSPFTSVRSTSHDRMIGRRLLDCGMRHRQSRAPRGIFGRQKQ